MRKTATPMLLTDLRWNPPHELEAAAQEIINEIFEDYGEAAPGKQLEKLSEILTELKEQHERWVR